MMMKNWKSRRRRWDGRCAVGEQCSHVVDQFSESQIRRVEEFEDPAGNFFLEIGNLKIGFFAEKKFQAHFQNPREI